MKNTQFKKELDALATKVLNEGGGILFCYAPKEGDEGVLVAGDVKKITSVLKLHKTKSTKVGTLIDSINSTDQ